MTSLIQLLIELLIVSFDLTAELAAMISRLRFNAATSLPNWFVGMKSESIQCAKTLCFLNFIKPIRNEAA